MTRPRSSAPALGLAVAVVLVLSSLCAVSSADPFYDRLLRDGIQAYERGGHALAVKNLRLACFGLLDEPAVLARGLTYLALAQAEIGEDLEFSKTFDRILEIEARFQAFSGLELAADLRQTFEGHLHRLIAVDALQRLPAFRGIARRKLEEQIHALAPAERRLELERLVVAEPRNPAWGLLLAELELEAEAFAKSLATAENVLASLPADAESAPRRERALCLRGRAGAAEGSCQQALVDLDSCQELVDQMTLIEARLGCHVRLRDWQNASTVLAEVPLDKRKKAPYRQYARDVRRGLKADASRPADTSAQEVAQEVSPGLPAGEELPEPDVATVEAPPGPTPAPDTPPDPPPAVASEPEASSPEAPRAGAPVPAVSDPATWPPELISEIERARQLLLSGTREQLEEVLVTLQELADRHRQLTEPQHLAAEIAYRLSRWQEAVTLFQRGGDPGVPQRLFYLSVALYEIGDRAQARQILERCLPSLEMTAFVRSYVDQILGADAQATINGLASQG